MRSFATHRMNVLLKGQAFGAVGALVWRLSDMIIAGNIVGVDALAGIAATIPVFIGAQFLAKMVYCGAGYLFAKRQGEFEPEKAREVVGTALEAAIAVGVLSFLAMFFGRDLYLDAMGITGEIRVQAVAYWRWMMFFVALNPFTMAMWRLVYADGETVTTAIGDLSAPFLVVILSILFTKMTGSAAGSALGTLIGGLIADLTMMLHLFRKSNAVVPKWTFSLHAVRELASYSTTDASARLCQCGFMAVLNRLVVSVASVAYLPVVGMISLILELREVLDRIGDAYMPIAEMYLGESNVPRLKELANYAAKSAVVIGFAFMFVVAVFAPQIVSAYGIPRGEVFDQSVSALRICSAVLPFSSVLTFFSSHYLAMDRIRLSVVETVAEEFLLTASCSLGFCYLWGFDAIWFGIPVGGLLTLVLIVVYSRKVNPATYPMLIPSARGEVLNLTFRPVAERIVEVRDAAERFLLGHGVSGEIVPKVMLLVEECAMTVLDDNGGSRGLLAEISFIVAPDETRMVMRDTGKLRDITDDDARVSSLRSFVISGLMRSQENRRYLTTIGCNRAAFSFPNRASRLQSHA